jgi:two-component system NarL family response regulator
VSEFTSIVRVAVVDRAPLFRIGVGQALAAVDDFDVVVCAGSATELDAFLVDGVIDVVLLDSGVSDGCAAVSERMRQVSPRTHIIVVVHEDDDTELAGAVRAGARGYVRRDLSEQELITAIRTVASGSSLISPVISGRFLDEFAAATRRSDGINEGTSALSRRELDVLRLIAQGLNNKAIAHSLYISENTVKNHVRSIHEKLQVHSRMEAVVRAVHDGLLQVG